MTEIQYEVREKDLIAFNEYEWANLERTQKTIRRNQAIIPGIIAIIALLLFFYFKDIPSAIYVILIAMACGLGIPFYLKWDFRRKIRQKYTEEEKASILGPYTLKIEKDNLVVVSNSGEEKIRWKKVLRIEKEKKYLFVYVSLNAALIVPIATVAKTSKLGEFVKIADERIEQAG